MRSILPLIALPLLLAACGDKTPTPDKDGWYPPILPEGSVPSCDADADCVLGCISDGSCCPDPCAHCEIVYNAEQYTRVQQLHEKMCADWTYNCISADCAEPEFDREPRCVKGRCRALKKIPIAH